MSSRKIRLKWKIISAILLVFIIINGINIITKQKSKVDIKQKTSQKQNTKSKGAKTFNSEPMDKKNWPEENINNELSSQLDDYLMEIKSYTGFQVDASQEDFIVEYIASYPVYKLSSVITAEHRKDFDSKRKGLISLWEEHYNRNWPKYLEDLKENGTILRYKGQNYDAHHIIEVSYNGPNQWWNLVPAMYGSQHQNGIHGSSTIASKLFSKEK